MQKLLILLVLLSSYVRAYPVTVDNCGQPLVISKKPVRMITHDVNITEMAFALHLQPSIIGITGVAGRNKRTKQFEQQQGDIPVLANRYAPLETILINQPDLFFSGWGYGMNLGGAVTPANLRKYGINTLILSESCIRINQAKYNHATMNYLYDDMIRLGIIFDKQLVAAKLVQQWQQKIKALGHSLIRQKPLRVFVYDSGQDKALTAGRCSILTAMIASLGSNNIMDDLAINWGRVSWEVVAIRQPELIILIDYMSRDHVKDSQIFLENHPLMKLTPAVRNKRYVVLNYLEVTPSPSNIEGIEKIAEGIRQP